MSWMHKSNFEKGNIYFSIFWWTNETVNIWSHIFGWMLFFGLTLYDLCLLNIHAPFGDKVIVALLLICFQVIFKNLFFNRNNSLLEMYKNKLFNIWQIKKESKMNCFRHVWYYLRCITRFPAEVKKIIGVFYHLTYLALLWAFYPYTCLEFTTLFGVTR